MCCRTSLWNINVRKQEINDKLEGSVAAYLRCDGVVNNRIKNGLLLSLPAKKIKLVNIRQSYKQNCGYLVHFLPLLAVHWPGSQSDRLGNKPFTDWQVENKSSAGRVMGGGGKKAAIPLLYINLQKTRVKMDLTRSKLQFVLSRVKQ